MRGNFFVKHHRTRSEYEAVSTIITRKIFLEEDLYLVFDEEGTQLCSEQEKVRFAKMRWINVGRENPRSCI